MSFISRKINFTTRILLLTDLLISLVVCNRPRKIAREFIIHTTFYVSSYFSNIGKHQSFKINLVESNLRNKL